MASLKEDSINFDKLESGVHQAIDAENLYWLQNDAKFRAVKQKGSYDEFKEIVAAAHLQPLAKDDKIQLEERIVSPWNTLSKSASSVGQTKTIDSERTTDFTVPNSSHAFILHWRKQKTHLAKVGYLHQILETSGPDRIATLFKNEIPFGLLGEFTISISSELERFNSALLVQLLEALTQTGRFSISLTFLSSSEKNSLSKIFSHLETFEVDCTALKELYQL